MRYSHQRKVPRADEIVAHDFILTTGRYVGAEAQEDDGEPFEDTMKRLTATLQDRFHESTKLERAIRAKFEEFGIRGLRSHFATSEGVLNEVTICDHMTQDGRRT